MPANQIIEATSAAGAVATFTAAQATDTVGVASIIHSKASGSTFAIGITVTALTADLVGVTSLRIISATSSEPDNGLGDGDTAVDTAITGLMTINLRAERSGKGNGRTYTIKVEAKDAAGNATTRTVTVSVPKSQGGR